MQRKMRRAGLTSVQIRPEVAKMVARLVRQGMSKSELINEALRRYLMEREFQELRSRIVPYAQAKGIYTDEDAERTLE